MNTRRAIIDLVNKGYEYDKICKTLGLKSKSSIYRVTKGTDLNRKRPKTLRNKMIYDAIASGSSQTSIAKSFGVSQPYINKMIKSIKWVEVGKVSTISSTGIVKQKGETAKLLEDNGYKYTRFLDSFGVKRYIHELVAEHFVPNPSKLENVVHKDGDKTNNLAENLSWVA